MVSISSKCPVFQSSPLIHVPKATRDTFYLDIGERILTDITYRSKVKCGLAGIEDLRTNLKDDRMESFALSETLKVRDSSLGQLAGARTDRIVCSTYTFSSMKIIHCIRTIQTSFSQRKGIFFDSLALPLFPYHLLVA